MANGATSCVTTAPAPTMAPRPIVTPGRIVALVPMSAQAPIADRLDLQIGQHDWDVGREPVCAEPSTFAPGPQPT